MFREDDYTNWSGDRTYIHGCNLYRFLKSCVEDKMHINCALWTLEHVTDITYIIENVEWLVSRVVKALASYIQNDGNARLFALGLNILQPRLKPSQQPQHIENTEKFP